MDAGKAAEGANTVGCEKGLVRGGVPGGVAGRDVANLRPPGVAHGMPALPGVLPPGVPFPSSLGAVRGSRGRSTMSRGLSRLEREAGDLLRRRTGAAGLRRLSWTGGPPVGPAPPSPVAGPYSQPFPAGGTNGAACPMAPLHTWLSCVPLFREISTARSASAPWGCTAGRGIPPTGGSVALWGVPRG